MFKSYLLTIPLLAYLKCRGYTHIQKLGPNEEAQEFYMRALKKAHSHKPFVEDINDD